VIGEALSVPASDVLRRIAAGDPERLVLDAGADRMTYAELDAAATSVAHALRGRLGPGLHHVVLCMESTKPLLVATLALWRAGLVSVPVDTTMPGELLRHICVDVDAPLILGDSRGLDAGGLEVVDPLELIDEPPADWEDVPPGEYVAIGFTSGSTGEPKGILASPAQRAIGEAFTGGADTDAQRQGVVVVGSSNASEVQLHSFVGMGVTIVPYEVRRRGLTEFREWLRNANVVALGSMQPVLRHLVATLDEDEVLEGVPPIYVGGDATTWEDVAEIRRRLSPDAEIVNIFGSTESGPAFRYVVRADAEPGVGPLPLGTPVGSFVELVDADGKPVREGEIGEIVVTGRQTALGYWKRPEETAATFTDLGDGLRRVRTGDLGRLLPDGNVEFRGRADHLVKIAGSRVELGHLEAALRLLDGVADAAATTYVDDAGEDRLTACVVPAEGRLLHPTVLRVELARRVPAPILPDGITVLDALPRLPGGKVDRQRLPVARRLPGESQAPPQTELEERILLRWREVLGVEGLGVEDDFFTVGGDSLRGARVIIGMNEELGVDLPVSVLVEAPTVRELAALVETGAARSPLVLARGEGSGPPLFVVHDAFGEVVHTQALATLLPEGFPIYGVLGEALEGRPIPERSVEELAAGYIAAIRTVSPQGPYRLYGASAGGTIAFEMARQLRSAGEEVPLLVLGDSMAPGFGPRERAAARASELRGMSTAAAARHAAGFVLRHAAFRVRRLFAWATGQDRRFRARWAAMDELLQKALAGEATVPVALRGQFASRVYASLTAAYMPGDRYGGPVTILRCAESTFPDEPWDRYVTGRCTQIPIGGSHFDLAKESGLRKVAAVLAPQLVASA